MRLEPPSLNLPLYRRDSSGLWFVLASCACGWLWHRPTGLLRILISVVLGGAAFWLALGPGLERVRYHRSFVVRALFLVLTIGPLLAVMLYLVPALHAYVSRSA